MSDHRSDERIAVGGTANLARYGDSFDSAVRPLLEALEEHVVLLKLLGESTGGGMVTVRIGHEGPYEELSSTSVVATGYGPRRRRPGHPGRGRPDPDGLPRIDGRRPRGGPLRLPHPRRGLSLSDSRTDLKETNVEPGPVRPARCRPRRGRRHHQEGLPTPRPPAAPRRQPGPGDPGAVQGRLAGLRGALRPAEAGGVRPRRQPVRQRRRLRPGCRVLVHRHHGRLLRRAARAPPARAVVRDREYAAARTP